jgi:hypothetical protein
MKQIAFLTIWLLAPLAGFCAGASTPLAEHGRALEPIIISTNASAQTIASADILAEYLGRISGAGFEVKTGDGATGIVVGRAEDFPKVDAGAQFHPADAMKREEYLLRSHAGGVWLLGASDLAVRHAVWDLLSRIGWRQFFPGKTWEIVPSLPDLGIAVDAFERPSYHSRLIWYGFGPWDYAKATDRDWCEKNRAEQGVELNTGHAYDAILARNQAAFAAHPEYLGLVGGERKSTKFCISNPGLRRLVVEDALAQVAANPEQQAISMEPSDGGGWCECDACAKLGSITDRALLLANAVAEAVSGKYPGKLVGMYAYNQHSPPPGIRAHPAVVVSIATGFVAGGFTVDELFDGWSSKAKTLGVREYYSVNPWDHDLPGAARGGDIDYLKRTIPHFYDRGARFLSAESGDNWGPNGLGYYLAARMMWDVGEAKRVDELTADFLDKCFGPARGPMANFYALLDGAKRQPLSDDVIGRMYRLLGEARRLTQDAAILQRLDDLTLYTRYVELWLDYSSAKDAKRQAAFEAMIRHAYRMRRTEMIHTLALYRDLAARDKAVAIPADAVWNAPEGKNPWKNSAPFTREELDGFLRDGIANRKLLDFTPVSFSRALVLATRLNLVSGAPGTMGAYSRSPRNYYSWVEKAPAALAVNVTAGIIYQTSGPAKLDLYPAAEAESKSVAHAEAPPTRAAQSVELKTPLPGLQRLEIIGGGAAQATWADGVPMTVESSFEHPGDFYGRWTLYFYVPRSAKTIGGFSKGPGVLRDPNGALARTFDERPGFFNVAVPPGEGGRLWKFEACSGDKMLMTVPPFLARSAAELLLPREVVEADSRP